MRTSRGASDLASPRRVLVALHSGGFNGIETYAEQVAIAGAVAGLDVTLLTATASGAEELRERLKGTGVAVLDAGVAEPSANVILAERLVPSLMIRRLSAAIRRAFAHREANFDAVHLNRAALAPAVRHLAKHVCAAGWFYPHAPGERVIETWSHTRGNLARRAVLAAKSVGFYRGDEAGYRASDCVVACTERLAEQLRTRGFHAVACPPPVRVLNATKNTRRCDSSRARACVELLICSGDLSHPRKNLLHAVQALSYLVKPGREVVLYAIGRAPAALEDAATLARAVGVRVEFLGPKAPRDVHQKMREVDAFLFPSLFEEWGYVAVEALLSGTPVVAYPVYPFADMLSGGLGVIADGTKLEPQAFARAIERAIAGETREDLAEAACARFGSAAVGARLARIWTGADSAVAESEVR
jgi:glycosyltransferase involved in cell wall biosynthesis